MSLRTFSSFVLVLAACGGQTTSAPPSDPTPVTTPPAPTVAPAPAASFGPAERIAPATAPISSLAVDESGVYWTTLGAADDGEIFALRRGATEPQVLATGQAVPKDLHVSLGKLTWANTRRGAGAVLRVATTGGPPEVLATAGMPVTPTSSPTGCTAYVPTAKRSPSASPTRASTRTRSRSATRRSS